MPARECLVDQSKLTNEKVGKKKVGIEFSFSSFLVANNSLHFLKHASLFL
jgi:hypothetical protein